MAVVAFVAATVFLSTKIRKSIILMVHSIMAVELLKYLQAVAVFQMQES